MPTQTETDGESAREAALELGRELSKQSGLNTRYFEVHEDALVADHVSLRVHTQGIAPSLAVAVGSRAYRFEYIGESDRHNDARREVYVVRTDGDVHEGVY